MSKTAAEILADLDLFADDQREHLLDALAIARRECPVLPVRAEGRYHLVTRYDDVREVCGHPEVYSSEQPGIRVPPVRLIPLDTDPPDHRRYRHFLNPYFSRPFLLRYENEMRAVAREAIGRFIDAGGMEVVHDYSVPFVSGSLARVVFATGPRLRRGGVDDQRERPRTDARVRGDAGDRSARADRAPGGRDGGDRHGDAELRGRMLPAALFALGMDAAVGRPFNISVPFQVWVPGWLALVMGGSTLAALAPASLAARLVVREALSAQ